ncbi:MAG: choice-of-anchor D domain-containing protein [Verrucomicrobia bacterium]|nr:choice-of-anchor D domain-containing protein [Verrucomicrobiota bacterium]
MKTISTAIIALALAQTAANAVTFTANTTIGVGDATYENQEIVVNGCTLTVDGGHRFTSLLLTGGAVLTHSAAPAGEPNNRLDLTIAGAMEIDATSRVDATAKGHAATTGPGAGINSGAYPSGGGHGGPGGNSYGGPAGGVSYGDLLAPTQGGSGGGNSINFGLGGAGGGVVRLNVGGALTVAGQLTANGESGRASSGAGGSIHLSAGTLAGNGSIAANGGSASIVGAGGGGGGRIALYYGSSTFSGGLTALGGLAAGTFSGNSGGAGTLYTHATSQSVGDLRLDNTGRTNAVETLLTGPVPYRLVLTNVTAFATTPITFSGLRVGTGGLLTHPFQGPRLQVLVQGNAVVEGGGAIAADARGYPAHTGPGAGSGGMYGFAASGAGHGGQGGAAYDGAPGGVTYDSEAAPVDYGSGGGGSTAPNRGGGAMQLTVEGTLTVDGRVSVNADAVTGGYDGGGAGGSIWLSASRLNGAGSITANGQACGYSLSGGGGGGRLAIYTGIKEFPGSVAANGGQSGTRPGSNGTVHYGSYAPPVPEIEVEQPLGTPIADGGSLDFGVCIVGVPKSLTFTIKNTGTGELSGLGITIDGANATDFTLLAAPGVQVPAGGSTTFELRFAPSTGGSKSASLHLASNDADENPFDIALAGRALSATMDTDGDGMNDVGEFMLTTLGFDWQVPQPALVRTYFDAANVNGLFTRDQVQALHVGTPLLVRDPVSGMFKLTIGIEKSVDLLEFLPFPMTAPQVIINAAGCLEFSFLPSDNAAFYRLECR